MTINKVLGTTNSIIWQLSLFLDWGMEVVDLPLFRNFECNTIIPQKKEAGCKNTIKKLDNMKWGIAFKCTPAISQIIMVAIAGASSPAFVRKP
jgi:hypothetical protein